MSSLFYYDELGYQVPHRTEAAHATSKAPPGVIPAGKVARWNDEDWDLVDAPTAASTTVALTDTQIESLPQVLTYYGDGTLHTVTAGPDADGNSYVQTFVWTAGALTSFSAWVKQ